MNFKLSAEVAALKVRFRFSARRYTKNKTHINFLACYTLLGYSGKVCFKKKKCKIQT